MKLLPLLFILPSIALAREPFQPDLGLGQKYSTWPLPAPDTRIPTGPMAHRVTWTIAGASGARQFVLDVCQDTFVRCEEVKPGDIDWGYRMYRKDSGAYLGTVDRNVHEEVQVDYARAADVAEQHHPESAWVARKEAEKARLEYILAGCSGGAVYCTSMASKLPKFKELFSASCSVWSGFCITKVTELKTELQKQIDYVKSQCALNDQACFDAVTNGGETQARAQRQIEKSIEGGTGSRPPHNTTAGRPPFMPGNAEGDPTKWYDPSCQHCELYDGKGAEDY